ncbi:MAG: hypothetical protein K8R76_06025 [Candidatus Aegiribacteria sp.]|nr:hypothetical protein [Candidatus Aegiribacteria sp.]
MMTHKTTVIEIVDKALMHLRQVIPIGEIQTEWEQRANDNFVLDAIVHFEELLQDYQIEIKKHIRRDVIGAIQMFLERVPKPRMLITTYVTPPIAKELRERNIQFIDTAGNMYIKQEKPFVFVFIAGKREDKTDRITTRTRLFHQAALRVLFILLCDPNAKDRTYREIAEMAGVALGTVNNVFADLKHYGYIRIFREKKIFDNRQKLIDKWTDAFINELRPRLNPRRFTTKSKNWWQIADTTEFGVYLGGETAAAKLTGYLHPENATVYVGEQFGEFAKVLKLKKDNHGEIFVLNRFWNNLPKLDEFPGVVPPLLIYADLVAADGARNLETAEMIRKQYLD